MIKNYNDFIIDLNYEEMACIDGGRILSDFFDAVKSAGRIIGYGVGQVAGVVKDIVTSGSAEANETLMNCI